MAKQGQHEGDAQDPRVSKGPNNPDKSVTITTGSYKKRSTTRAQHARGEATTAPAQADSNEWQADTRAAPTTRERRTSGARSGRSGSESNADAGSRGH